LFPELSVSQKVPGNEPPSGSPMGALMERDANFQILLLHASQVPHKNSPDKKTFFTLLSNALGKERPPMFPRRGPFENAHFQSLT
jgi:hypothetical protein